MPNGPNAPFLLRAVRRHPKPPEAGLRAHSPGPQGVQTCLSQPIHVLQIED